VGRTLLSAALYPYLIAGLTAMPVPAFGGQECPPHMELLPDYSQANTVQLSSVEPRDLLPKPNLVGG
jgi:hypothetical protein